MKIKLILIAITCILALSPLACGQAGKEVAIQYTYDDFTQVKNQSRSIDAHIGDVIKITLPSNATSGFRWALANISDNTVLSQEGDSEYVLPESTALGAGGQEIWSFKALKRGTTTVSLAYSQAWEGGTKGAWTFTASVTVR
jgi:inhibitor of cysteine peptidase